MTVTRHYLIVNPRKKVVAHHGRGEAGEIATRIFKDGQLDPTPPGFTLPVCQLLPEAQSGSDVIGF